jgi:hypothetical protein
LGSENSGKTASSAATITLRQGIIEFYIIRIWDKRNVRNQMGNSSGAQHQMTNAPKQLWRACVQKIVTVAAVGLGCFLLAQATVYANVLSLTLSNDLAQVRLEGSTDRWHQIEAATNLVNWVDVTNFFATRPISSWVDCESNKVQRRFYRDQEIAPLDLYVTTLDTNYSFRLVNTIPNATHTTFILEMVSQAWLRQTDVDCPIWKHWLVIVEPARLTNEQTSFLFIADGYKDNPAPSDPSPDLLRIALDTHTIVSELRLVPNQPLRFAGEVGGRSEDAIIAYSWDKFLKTQDVRWPAQLAMTKAAVRSMDTICAFCSSAQGGNIKIEGFVISGVSKRGWTTWLTRHFALLMAGSHKPAQQAQRPIT